MPMGIEFKEVEAAQVANTLEDVDSESHQLKLRIEAA